LPIADTNAWSRLLREHKRRKDDNYSEERKLYIMNTIAKKEKKKKTRTQDKTSCISLSQTAYFPSKSQQTARIEIKRNYSARVHITMHGRAPKPELREPRRILQAIAPS
jgi:hypothetical protein